MALKRPTKPALKKLPKMPKTSASAEAWRNYENRVKAIEAENDKKIAEYKKKVAAYESELKRREAIKGKAMKAKAKLSGLR